MKWSGAAPCQCQLARRRVDGISRADHDDLVTAGLDQSHALGDVQRLPDGVAMPCGASTGCEVHGVDADTRGFFTLDDDVEPRAKRHIGGSTIWARS